MPLKKTPDPQDFSRNVSIQDVPAEAGQPMIAVNVDPQYAYRLLMENSGEKDESQKTYRFTRLTPYMFRLPLRDILGTEFVGPMGSFGEVKPEKIHSLADCQNPYGRAHDYEKLATLVYERIEAIRGEVMSIVQVIDMPPHIHELMDFKRTSGKKGNKLVAAFPSIEVDHERRTFTVSKAELAAFPNPLIIYRCLREIQSLDGYTVLLTETDGVSVRYEDSKQIWPNETFPDLSARDRYFRQ